jgi:hypothetical protein
MNAAAVSLFAGAALVLAALAAAAIPIRQALAVSAVDAMRLE